MPLGGYRGAI